MWADGTATNLDPVEIKERQDRYLEMLLAMHEQFRTIELLAPKRVMETAYYLVHSLPDIWSHEEIPAPMPDYALAADAFMAAARADLGAVD
jgi:hypothetical protein